MGKITTLLALALVLVLSDSTFAAESEPAPGEIGYVNENGHVLVSKEGSDFNPNDPKVRNLIYKHRYRINKERKEKAEKLEKEKSLELVE